MSLARNYAKALFELTYSNGTTKAGRVEGCRAELAAVWTVIEASRDLHSALTAPVSSALEKQAIVAEVTRRLKTSKPAGDFLLLLAQNDRIGELPAILAALDEVRLESEGGVLGAIVSADPLDPAATQEITDAYSQKLKKKVEFRVSTDADLLAGLKVTVNGVTYDGTLRSQLDRLRESFVQGAGLIH